MNDVIANYNACILHNVARQRSASYCTRATLGTTRNFQWHAEAPSFAYQFCYDSSRKRHIDLDLYQKMYVIGTLNDLKP